MKEIKIMVRADFAGDVALWIFFIIYIYTFPRICIFIIIALLPLCGPLLDYSLVVFPRVGYGRALISSGRP